MYNGLRLLFTGVLIFFISSISFAQETPKDALYLVHSDVIAANKVLQYEKAVNEMLEQFKAHNFGGEIRFASSSDDNEYYYLTPLSSYADLDATEKNWTELYEKAGEETMAKIDKQFEDCYEHHNNYVVKWSSELSYRAENPRLNPEDVNFIHWDYFWIEEGKEMQAMEISKKYKELYAKNNITESYNVWMADIGHDIGMMVVTRNAKDHADYYDQRGTIMDLMKDELNDLRKEFYPLLKDFDHKNGKPRPEWIYSPTK
jgi:hypothetical protein